MTNPVTIERGAIRKILVIKLRAIGDVLLSTAVLPNLRRAFQDARIDFLAEAPSRDILEGNPYLNGTIIFNGKKESGISLIRRVRRERYDMVIDLFGNPRSAIVTRLSGAAYRVGFRLGWRERCYNIVLEPRGGEVHNTEFNLDALRGIGIPVTDNAITVPVDPDSDRAAEQFFLSEKLNGRTVVALNPGGGWYTKRWLPARYAALGDALAREFGAEIVLTWGPGEERIIDEIATAMRERHHRIPLVGLKTLAAILRRCTFMVTNDSGPMHIGAAMKTPIVAIFGPTRPHLQGPHQTQQVIVTHPGLVCLGCNYTDCPIGNPCMKELEVDTVLAGARELAGRLGLHSNHSVNTESPAFS